MATYANSMESQHNNTHEHTPVHGQYVDALTVQDAIESSANTELDYFATELGGLYYAISETESEVHAIDHQIKNHDSSAPSWMTQFNETGHTIMRLRSELAEQYNILKTSLVEQRTTDSNAFLRQFPGMCYVRLEDGTHAPLRSVAFPDGKPVGTIEIDGKQSAYTWPNNITGNYILEVDISQLPNTAQSIITAYSAEL